MTERQDKTLKPGERLSVLLADDDTNLLWMMSLDLRKDGDFEVLTATTCEEALAKLINQRPDLVFLDIKFEKGEKEDGIDCLKKMRDQGYQGPVFIFTGHTDVDLLLRAQKAGADDYLVKGGVDNLATELKRLLGTSIRRILSGQNFNRILTSGYLRTQGLTDSQLGVLAMMVHENYPQDEELAKHLGLNPTTLEVMLHRVRRQLNLKNTKQLARVLTILELFGHR